MATPSARYELSAMDNVLPRYFHGGIWALRLRDGVTQDQVISMLRSSLASASLALPLLTRRAFSIPPTPENPVTGRLEAREHVDWTPVVDYNDLSNNPEWPDYDELMEDGFPQDLLDGAVLLPSSRFGFDPETGTPLLVAQANFVKGGLLLGVSLYHALMDGMSMALIFRTWAQHMRLQQGEEPGPAEMTTTPLGQECFDYNTLVDVWKKAGSPVAEPTPDEWRMLGLLPPQESAGGGLRLPGSGSGDGGDTPAPVPPPAMSTGIFYVSASAIARLSAIAANEPGATANDALMALLWRCTIRARRAAVADKPCYAPGAITEMDTTINGRAMLGDLLPWQYMGTLVFFTTTKLTVGELVAPITPLESIIRAVRSAVASVTRERILAGYGLAATRLPDFGVETLQRPMPTFEGAEFGVTSLLSLPILDWSFGSAMFANGGIPDHMRQERRLFDMVCRYCSIGPLRREGGTEVLVSLTVEEMEFLEGDEEFAQFAELLCH